MPDLEANSCACTHEVKRLKEREKRYALKNWEVRTIRPNYNSLINLIYSKYITNDLVKLAEIYTCDSNEVKEQEKEECPRNNFG